MNETWYIWYEIYENDKPLPNSKGRYYYPYKHKCNAERRAKQMWGGSLYDPRARVLQKRKWIVSQTCPWEDVYVFDTIAEAENLIIMAKVIARKYGVITRSDVMDLAGVPNSHNVIDNHFGWLEEMFNNVKIIPSTSVYLVEFPRAFSLI